jgi:ferric-dicitrate binding protein FerR (iron transport regulator)
MNKITAEQVERFFASRCTPEEAEVVAQYLQANPAVLKEYIQRDWKEADAGGEMPEGYGAAMFREIKTRLQEEEGKWQGGGRVLSVRRWMTGVAAAVLLVLAGIGIWKSGGNRLVKEKAIVAKNDAGAGPTAPAPLQTVHYNHSSGEAVFVLPDSSVVTLYAKSELRYPAGFDKDKRSLSLQGKALFAVKKDGTRPFIVTAGPIVTTVLGTEFGVTETRGIVTVKLYSGKVRLHAGDARWKKDILLSPGEQMDFVAKGAEVVVSRFDEDKEETEAEAIEMQEPVDEQELVFDNEPLPQVMDKLADCYHLTIKYNKKQIGNMYFTGTVLTSDSLTTILHVIANMNELIVAPGKRGYVLRKPVP